MNASDARTWGRVLSNKNKLRILVELSKTAMTKGKIAEVLKVAPSTVTEYVQDLLSIGLVYEEHVVNDSHVVRIIRLRCASVLLSFKDFGGVWDGS